jgi:hypothetical protein
LRDYSDAMPGDMIAAAEGCRTGFRKLDLRRGYRLDALDSARITSANAAQSEGPHSSIFARFIVLAAVAAAFVPRRARKMPVSFLAWAVVRHHGGYTAVGARRGWHGGRNVWVRDYQCRAQRNRSGSDARYGGESCSDAISPREDLRSTVCSASPCARRDGVLSGATPKRDGSAHARGAPQPSGRRAAFSNAQNSDPPRPEGSHRAVRPTVRADDALAPR